MVEKDKVIIGVVKKNIIEWQIEPAKILEITLEYKNKQRNKRKHKTVANFMKKKN